MDLRTRLLEKIRHVKYSNIWYRRRIRDIQMMTKGEKSARGIRRTVRLLSNFPGLWQRTIEQTPGGCCQWGSTLFVADGEADHYVILNSICHPAGPQPLPNIQLPDASRVWGLHMEPEPYVKLLSYDDSAEHAFTSRFYTNCEELIARGGIYRACPPYVHFHVGRSWDFLNEAPLPAKKIDLSIISSGLNTIEGHKTRLDFLTELDTSDIDCVIWGRGDNLRKFRKYQGPLGDKWPALAASRHSIVIENSVSPWYWSEKPVDALLAYAMPLYHGSPELGRFLPQESFRSFDITRSDRIKTLRDLLATAPYESHLPAIKLARARILQHENLYAFLDRELDAS